MKIKHPVSFLLMLGVQLLITAIAFPITIWHFGLLAAVLVGIWGLRGVSHHEGANRSG